MSGFFVHPKFGTPIWQQEVGHGPGEFDRAELVGNTFGSDLVVKFTEEYYTFMYPLVN